MTPRQKKRIAESAQTLKDAKQLWREFSRKAETSANRAERLMNAGRNAEAMKEIERGRKYLEIAREARGIVDAAVLDFALAIKK